MLRRALEENLMKRRKKYVALMGIKQSASRKHKFQRSLHKDYGPPRRVLLADCS